MIEKANNPGQRFKVYGDYKMRIDKKEILHTDILIIGGGTAGCYAAMTIREHSDYSVIIAEKA